MLNDNENVQKSVSLSDNQQRILIVGSDGMIGSALMSYLNNAGETVIGTTRRQADISSLKRYLDLSEDTYKWIIPTNIKVAVILAGISKVIICENKPELTRRINVNNLLILIRRLIDNGVFIIYLSTSQVFDGNKPFQKYNSPLKPITEYGMQRANVEMILKDFKNCVAILRSTKIFGHSVPLFNEWTSKMRRGIKIYPYSDMTIAPIPINCILSVIRLIIDQRAQGIYQISGDRDISYVETAIFGAKLLNLNIDLIHPILGNKAEKYRQTVLKYTSLDMDRIKKDFGFIPPKSEWTIQQTFSRMLES